MGKKRIVTTEEKATGDAKPKAPAASTKKRLDRGILHVQSSYNNTKVILTNQVNALAVYTTTLIDETIWDSAFVDAVVRRLANPLAMAVSGRPDFARTILEQAAMMAQTAEMIDEGGFRRFAGGG